MLDWKPAFKASTALMITSLTTFSSGFDELSQGFSYFVSLAVLFFHPARTVGAMVESVLCCAIGLAVGYFIASSCLIVVEYYDQSGNSIAEAHIIAILVLFLTTFCLAFIRAKYSSKRQVIATACSVIFNYLLKVGSYSDICYNNSNGNGRNFDSLACKD